MLMLPTGAATLFWKTAVIVWWFLAIMSLLNEKPILITESSKAVYDGKVGADDYMSPNRSPPLAAAPPPNISVLPPKGFCY